MPVAPEQPVRSSRQASSHLGQVAEGGKLPAIPRVS